MEQQQFPEIKIHAEYFLVDAANNVLIEKGNPNNVLHINEMQYHDGDYHFEYDVQKKQISNEFYRTHGVIITSIPSLNLLDPVGFASKYNLNVEKVAGLPDGEAVLLQESVQNRLKGQLTTLEIAGHTYYVDWPMQTIRPKDDFSTLGISFRALDYFPEENELQVFVLVDTKKHEHFSDMRTIEASSQIPDNVQFVKFPHVRNLDPVGYSRYLGTPLQECLLGKPYNNKVTAEKLSWNEIKLVTSLTDDKKKPLRLAREDRGKVGKSQKKGRRL